MVAAWLDRDAWDCLMRAAMAKEETKEKRKEKDYTEVTENAEFAEKRSRGERPQGSRQNAAGLKEARTRPALHVARDYTCPAIGERCTGEQVRGLFVWRDDGLLTWDGRTIVRFRQEPYGTREDVPGD